MKSVFRAAALLILFCAAAVSRADVKVLASLHPLALVAASVTPAEDLSVLVPAGMTPHDFSLKPSDIRRIREAGIIFWGGEQAEPYLVEFARRWPDKQWIDISQFAPQDDHETGHSGHDEHGNGHNDEHESDEHESDEHESDEHESDEHHDPHWWLAPDVMIRAQAALAAALNKDPAPFAAAVTAQLDSSRSQLAVVKEQGFFVFHRAYDHWVEAMDLKQLGAFTISPERKPGMKTLQAMREQLQNGDVRCVFSEPEFSPAILDSAVRGLDIRRGELDPMAASIAITSDGYVRYLQHLTGQFHSCLAG